MIEDSIAIVILLIAVLKAVFDHSSAKWTSLNSAAPTAEAINANASPINIDTPCHYGCLTDHLDTYARVFTNGCSVVVTDFEDR